MQVVPIGSGKGGVGKSVIATNLAIALAEIGKKVVLVDLDLGGSNIHTILGQRAVTHGIGTFLNNGRMKFEEILIETEYNGMRFVPGDTEMPGIANLKSYQKKRLMRNLLSLEADYLVVDLGAGTSANVVDFFIISGSGILVTSPTLIAVLNAYLFLKNVVFRLIYTFFPRKSPGNLYVENLRKAGNALQKIYLPKLFDRLQEEDPENYREFVCVAARLHPRLVLNMIEDPKDIEKLDKLKRSVSEYLAISLEHLGVIYRDKFQDIALSARIPILKYKPNSILAQAIYRMRDKIIRIEAEAPLDVDSLEESFQFAEVEAEKDYRVKLHNLEELLHCGALTTGDLIETLRSQQFEIQQLKKENQLLKTKLVRVKGADL